MLTNEQLLITLDGRRTKSKNLISGSFCVAVHVQEDMDAVLVDSVGRFAVARDLRKVYEVLRLAADLLPERRVVIWSQARIASKDF